MVLCSLDSIRSSLYFNLIAPREAFIHYHKKMRDDAIKIQETKKGHGKLAVEIEQLLSNPTVQKSIDKCKFKNAHFYSTSAHRFAYEKTYSYRFMSSLRDLIKGIFSNIFPDLKKY